jgi:hypothetical protein
MIIFIEYSWTVKKILHSSSPEPLAFPITWHLSSDSLAFQIFIFISRTTIGPYWTKLGCDTPWVALIQILSGDNALHAK